MSSWVSKDLVAPSVAGTSVTASDVISKVFSSQDPRFLVVEVSGTLAAYTLEGRNGDGNWRVLQAALTNGRLVFNSAVANDLLDDQLRVVAGGAGTVDNVHVVRSY